MVVPSRPQNRLCSLHVIPPSNVFPRFFFPSATTTAASVNTVTSVTVFLAGVPLQNDLTLLVSKFGAENRRAP